MARTKLQPIQINNEWWQEIGRVSGATSGTLSIASLASFKYLQVRITEVISGTSTLTMRFNNDSGSNYAYRQSVNAGADSTSASATSVNWGSGDPSPIGTIIIDIMNVLAYEKYFTGIRVATVTAGAANVPFSVSNRGKWANTSSAITRIDFLSTANFTTDTEMVVLGHN